MELETWITQAIEDLAFPFKSRNQIRAKALDFRVPYFWVIPTRNGGKIPSCGEWHATAPQLLRIDFVEPSELTGRRALWQRDIGSRQMHHLTLAILGYWGNAFISIPFFWFLLVIGLLYIRRLHRCLWENLLETLVLPPTSSSRRQTLSWHGASTRPASTAPKAWHKLATFDPQENWWQSLKSYHRVAYMNQFFISIPVMDGLMFYASILGKLQYFTDLN